MAQTADGEPHVRDEDRESVAAPRLETDTDDPLMALSQIVGVESPEAVVSQATDLDLEEALATELGVSSDTEASVVMEAASADMATTAEWMPSPEPEASNEATVSEQSLPDDMPPITAWPLPDGAGEGAAQADMSAPEAPLATIEEAPSVSLEDELTAMLSGTPPASDTSNLAAAPVEEVTEVATDGAAEATEPLGSDAATVDVPDLDDDLEPASAEADAGPVAAEEAETPDEADEEPLIVPPATAIEETAAVEPPPVTTVDPVDELASIMGLERAEEGSAAFAPASSQPGQPPVPDLSALDAEFESALARDLPELDGGGTTSDEQPVGARPQTGAPVLETVDMSGFDDVEPTDISVPQFEGDVASPRQPDSFADLEEDLAGMFGESERATAAGAGIGVAATAPTVADAISDFDAQEFEAELARDIEFVNHDLDTALAGADGDFDDVDGLTDEATDDPVVEKKDKRGAIVGLVIGGLAVVGVIGVLAMGGDRGTINEGPVLVEANPEPVKIQPEDPGGTTVPNQDRAVFAETEEAPPAQETLVSTAEEPLDIATAPTETLPSAVATGEKAEDRLVEGGTESTVAEPVETITPRRVRTLVVRPDGTLEERAPEEAVVPIETATTPNADAPVETATTTPIEDVAAPVETAAAVPADEAPVANDADDTVVADNATAGATPGDGATVAPDNDLQIASVITEPSDDAAALGVTGTDSTGVVAADDAASDAFRRADEAVETGSTRVASAPADQPVETAAAAEPAPVRQVQTTTATPPVIRDRPADQPVNVINRTQQTQTAAATPASAPVATAATSDFTVQLAALPSEAAARDTAAQLSRQYASLIGERGLTIQRADIEGRGTFYRVRVGTSGSGDATNLCNQIKASGGNCFVAR